MKAFLTDSLRFVVAVANHTFGMMYWIWIPSLVLSWLIHLRLHAVSRERLFRLKGYGSLAEAFWGGLFGFTGSSHLKSSLTAVRALFVEGVHPAAASAFLIARLNVIPYALAFTIVLFGLEFFIGQLLGALTMAVILWGLLKLVPAARWEEARRSLREQKEAIAGLPPEPDPRLHGWRGALRYTIGEFRKLWLAMLVGIVLAGMIGAFGRTEWAIDLTMLGGGGLPTEFLNAAIGSLLALLLFVPPIGHVFAASFLWKAYILSYAGVVSYILASLVNPRAIQTYLRMYGPTLGLYVAASGLLSAAIGALSVHSLFALVDFEVTHTPLFHETVGKLMEFFSLFGGM